MAERFLSVTFAVLLASGSMAGAALAKRPAPEEVPPFVTGGTRYEIPHFQTPCGGNGGCVVAYDDATGKQLWSLKVYCTHYDSSLERDVQDVFITSLVLDHDRLLIEDEKGRHFEIDPETRTVAGDARGCNHGGCNYMAPAQRGQSRFWLPALALVWILWQRRRSLTARSARRGRRAPGSGTSG
jgi:hypothetical protein